MEEDNFSPQDSLQIIQSMIVPDYLMKNKIFNKVDMTSYQPTIHKV
ncbi:MAG: hypothetical protein ABIN94_12010 [Ferruginibacter sp.]